MLESPNERLRKGSAILDSVLCEYGFEFKWGGSGQSSGGSFAFGAFVTGDRKLELHYRHSLGLVEYHFGKLSVDHESYMRVVLGPAGGNHYPGFSEKSEVQFDDLKFDLEHFATAFLLENAEEFSCCAAGANHGKGDWVSRVSPNSLGSQRIS
jgi:hypothetical protein